MIPKIIHFCWLSGEPYPPLIEHCINSWREKLPGYQFVLWDKAKADGIASEWVQEAYRNRKYAFAADYIRCYALYHFGGIYLDADVEVLKNMDELLVCKSFLGYDSTGALEAAISVRNLAARGSDVRWNITKADISFGLTENSMFALFRE